MINDWYDHRTRLVLVPCARLRAAAPLRAQFFFSVLIWRNNSKDTPLSVMDKLSLRYEVPQDIVDSIIGLCEDDTLTLKSCSLVAKSWIIPSRRLLFKSLILGGARRVFRFRHQEPIPERKDSILQQLEELDGLLQSSPELALECIQSIRLRFESSATSPAYYDAGSNAVLCRILGRLKRVRTFYLHLGRWGEYTHKDPTSQVEAAIISLIRQPETETILLSNSELSSQSFSDLITHSPALKQLFILEPTLRDEHPIPIQSSPFTTYLSHLRIDSNLHLLGPAFLDPSFNLKIDKLRQARLRLAVHPEACELIRRLLARASCTLQDLELVDHPLFQDTPRFFPIHNLTNLRTLRFSGFRANGFHSSIRWITHVFSEMPCPIPLEEVYISTLTHRLMIPPHLADGTIDPLHMNGDKTVGEVMLWGPLQEIDRSLATDKFPRLRKLDISITIRDPYESSHTEFSDKTRRSLPLLSALHTSILVTLTSATY